MKTKLVFSLLVSAVMLSACRTIPLTGRTQFILTSVSEEKAIGLTEFGKYKEYYPISSNSRYNAAMKSCSAAVIKATEDKDYDWEYVVFQSKTQNAFCLPGGKIAVYSGLLDLMNNEAELAFVVAHEVAHALARHGSERSSWAALQKLGASVVASQTDSALAGAAFEKVSDLGVILPFSRADEYEADKIGMILMAKAGYNPSAAIEFWTRFTEDSSESVLDGWMSTHPRDSERIQALKANLTEAEAAYAACPQRKGNGMLLR